MVFHKLSRVKRACTCPGLAQDEEGMHAGGVGGGLAIERRDWLHTGD